MINQGVASQAQLNTLKSSLEELQSQYKNKTLTTPPVLSLYGLNHQSDLALLYSDIIKQLYKLHNALPGEMIKLSSMVAATFGITLFATRDSNGDFQIILDKNAVRMRIDTTAIDAWLPSQALSDRVQYFLNNRPAHLLPYLQEQEENQSYLLAIQTYLSDIEKLYLGETLVIDANTVPLQKHPLRIIKATSSDFEILLETFNPDEPFIRFDSTRKMIWKDYADTLLDEQAISFLNSIQKALDQFNDKGLPAPLAGLIQPNTLANIYQFIINHPHILKILRTGQSFRLPKELTKLDRTINIVREPSGEIMLMLETKRKLASGIKDKNRTIGQGTFGTVKPCWRIDTLIPEEWANKVMKNNYVKEADYEALFSQNLVESRSDTNNDVINVSLLGELFTSKGIVKRSQYSKRAVGDLLSVLYNPNIILTPNDKKRITKNILDGIAVMHAQGKAHQDLKLPNIFIYQDNEGYYAKVADFGISYDPALPLHKPSLASGGYESPEIMCAYESANSSYHTYFYQDQFIKRNSYAYKVHMGKADRDPESPEAIEFRKPHPANDMWALGIVLFELEYKRMPRFGFSIDEQCIENNPLFKGLLKPNRSDRFNILQALEKHREMALALPAKPETRENALTFTRPINIPEAPEIEVYNMPNINYSPVVGVSFLSLGNIEGPEGRMKRDVFINTLKKIYDSDLNLFKLILESQTTKDLERLNQSLIKYLLPPEKKILLFPELIHAVNVTIFEKKEAIAMGAQDEALAQQGHTAVQQLLKDRSAAHSSFKF